MTNNNIDKSMEKIAKFKSFALNWKNCQDFSKLLVLFEISYLSQ